MERPPQRYFCNKCGYVGSSDTHPGCNYFACPMAHLEQIYIDHLEAELEALRASPASAPAGFKHDIGADRFTVVQGSYWWHVRAGEGTQNIGKFHTKRAAEEMALTLLTAFRDGAFMQYQAMLAAVPTPPNTEDLNKLELYGELLYAVANKFPGESRHQTALRYIRNAEKGSDNATTQEGKP